MQWNEERRSLGIFGGVGPLASAKFVESIYLVHAQKVIEEQFLPKIILYSDPSMPDRTQYLEKGLKAVLLKRLIDGLSKLLALGADDLVIFCFTLHYLLNNLPEEIARHIVSLPHIALKKVISMRRKSLLLCTNATNKLKVFQNEPIWEDASGLVILPDITDQNKIHECIYQLKKNHGHDDIIDFIKKLLQKYQVDSWIAGCTEFHLINHKLITAARDKSQTIIDPAMIIVDEFSSDNDAREFVIDQASCTA